MRRLLLSMSALWLSLGIVLAPTVLAQSKPSLTVLSPANGDTITSTDIPVSVQVSNFVLSPADVGLPDKDGEGHIHVMLDGMNMGVLFNFYTSPTFTLPGQGIRPGQHVLTFDLASNTHLDMEDTVTSITLNYQPLTADPVPQPTSPSGAPEVAIAWPPNGAVLGPQFTLQLKRNNFTPALELEGKPNRAGFGHYHVFVDMDMAGAGMGNGMMSMAGMVGMPGSDSVPLDLHAWPNGQHTITVELVQNDHTPIPGSTPAIVSITLQDATSGQTTTE